MNGNNTQTKEGFIKALGHPRKKELAGMIIEGADVATMNEAGYDRISILEMARAIKTSVEGMEGVDIDIPRGEGAATATPIPGGEEEKVAAETEDVVEENTETPVDPVVDPAAPVETGQDTPVVDPAPVDPAAATAETVVDENAAPNTEVPPATQG